MTRAMIVSTAFALADAQAFGYAMEEARKADAAGDGAKCQKALDERGAFLNDKTRARS